MLDVGFSEILLTSAIALVVLGPERLPKVARQVGNWMGRARAMARQLSEQLEREVNAEELLKAQGKTKPVASLPGSDTPSPSSSAAVDPSYTHSIAPPALARPGAASPSVMVPTPGAQPTAIASPPATLPADSIPPAPREPEAVFGGLPASATTAAAMHAADPHVADSKPTHE